MMNAETGDLYYFMADAPPCGKKRSMELDLACRMEKMALAIEEDICAAASVLKISPMDGPLGEIRLLALSLIRRIGDLVKKKEIFPQVHLRLSEGDWPAETAERKTRLGIYPVSANPLHWGHLLIAMQSIAELRLDKVVFIVSGDDPRKPELVPADIRHAIACEVLQMFEPLFAYSDIALGRDLDGEVNAFRLLALNPRQKVEVFYLSGSDHFCRISSKGLPDTVQKIEQNIVRSLYHYDPARHRISLVFIERGKRGFSEELETPLSVFFLPSLPFEVSSTMVRKAFSGSQEKEKLSLIPYKCLVLAEMLNLYKSGSCALMQN